MGTLNISDPGTETTLELGQSKPCREPWQKEMEAGRGEQKRAGVEMTVLAKTEENRSNFQRKIVQLFGMNSFSL